MPNTKNKDYYSKYLELLEKAYKKMPEILKKTERFEIPKLESFIAGNKTIIKDFVKVMKILNRDPKVIAKIISQSIGTSFSIAGNDLILKGRFSAIEIKKLYEDFIKKFVLCDECKRPDTKILIMHGIKLLKCEACGAIKPLKERI